MWSPLGDLDGGFAQLKSHLHLNLITGSYIVADLAERDPRADQY